MKQASTVRWVVAAVMLVLSSLYLYSRYVRIGAAPPMPTPPAALERSAPTPFISVADIRKVRESLEEPDPGVRWAAVEFLMAVQDPDMPALLEKMLAGEPDANFKLKAITLLQSRKDGVALRGMIKSLEDHNVEVRLAALQGLAELGDPSATPWIVERLKDSEPEVKEEALRTLSRFQDRRREKFEELAQKLRQDYEEAVERARSRRL